MDAAVARPGAVRLLRLPLVALELLTVLRLRRPAIVEPDLFGKSQAFFPAAGFLLGGLLAGADSFLRDELGAAPTGWVLAGLLLALSGGLHADGLADTADGLFAASTPERRLEIMRDSAIGAFGAAALVIVLGLKATALGQLAAEHRAETLIVVPGLSRWAAVAAIAAFPYARREGLGRAFHANAWPWPAPLAGVVCLAGCIAGLGAAGAGAWALALALGVALGVIMNPRLGGLTGDTYGAVIEVSEVCLLLAAVAWSS